MRRSPIHAIALLAILIAGTDPLAAQDDRAAGLYTEARHLPLVSQSLAVRIAGGEAELRLVQVFVNDGDQIGQADYRLHLPQGATVDGFGFWSDGVFLAAELREKAEAEARHDRAAGEGRATAIARTGSTLVAFSVYPLGAGERKKVEIRLRLPVVRELGRSNLRLPIDAFLGQPGPSSVVLAEIEAAGSIADHGVSGARARTLARGERHRLLAFTAREAVELWWAEQGPPLDLRARAVPLDDGGFGLELTAALNDAGEWRPSQERLHVLVDASYSMRRRSRALDALARRLAESAPLPLAFHAVAERAIAVEAEDLAGLVLAGAAGHAATWEAFAATLDALGCGATAVGCAVIADPQFAGIEAAPAGLPLLLLTDPHELDFASARLPQATFHQVDVDADAHLLALADRLVRPVLAVRGLGQDGAPIELPAGQSREVAEGGLLRLFGRVPSLAALDLAAEVAGIGLARRLDLELLDPAGAEGRAVRRGLHRETLAGWMTSYRQRPEAELKARIVALSLKEGIPTAFTALQVDDPRLSLYAIKPGDPLLTVPFAPGIERVTAWYPFGEMRSLVRDAEGDFNDRFLVPRGWSQGAYRIEVFRHDRDGGVEQAHAWYCLDESGPGAILRYDEAAGLLRIDTGEATGEVASVAVHHEGGEQVALSPLGHEWVARDGDLPQRFTVELRDRAGNRTAYLCRLEAGELWVSTAKASGVEPSVVPAPLDLPMRAGEGALRVEGTSAVLDLDGRTLRFPLADAPLGSLDLTAALELAGGALIGTQGGDLVELGCDAAGSCRARAVTARFAHHPVTGIAPLDGGRWLVGVLGRGLWELEAGVLSPSRHDVGSRFVTGVLGRGREVLVATGYNGLWRLVGERAVKTRFPHDHVARLAATPRGVEVLSGFGRFRMTGRDRFVRLDDGTDGLSLGSRRLTAAADLAGSTWVASFDRGLLRLPPGGGEEGGLRLEQVSLALAALERHVNDLAVHDGLLWLATEGGLLAVDPARGDVVRRVLDFPVHDLDATPTGLAAATSRGLYLLDAAGAEPHRIDGQDAPAHAFLAVAHHDGAIYAGGIDGLLRFAPSGEARTVGYADGVTGGWVTALVAEPGRLLVGTYDEGVYELAGERAAPVVGLERQWVPPHGLVRLAGGDLWVGGTGMAPVRWRKGRAAAVAVPAGDVVGVHPLRNGLMLLTSEGLVSLPEDGRK